MTDVTETLTNFADCQDFPESAVNMMHLSLLDWSACALAGRDEPAAVIVRDMVLAEGGAGQAGLIGHSVRVPVRAAALVNGTASHALDFDDTHFAHIGHPSVAVIPAALAMAEHVNADMENFVKACLIGVEASVRFGVWLGRSHYQAGFHQTATAGAFGATLAAGRLMQLNGAQMANALGVVSTRASGLKSQFGTMGKPMNAGIAASNGVEAALLARGGFISNPLAIDGLLGFGQTHHGAGDWVGFDGIGQNWLFESISHKFHACCHGLHAMLEALETARKGVDAGQVVSIQITTNPRWRGVCDKPKPETGLEAKFSYALTAAMALRGLSTASLANYSASNTVNAGIVALRDRVELVFDATLPETASRVVLRLQNGSEWRGEHDLNTEIAPELRHQKLLAKADDLLGAEIAELLWMLIQKGGDLDPFLRQLSTGAEEPSIQEHDV